MKNNKGFGTREVMIVVLLVLGVTAILMATTLNGVGNQKVNTFKENASTFSKTIITNQASFKNVEVIYLGEAISEGFIAPIKNSLGSGECDSSQSKVEFKEGHAYTTFKCGEYLIDSYEIKNLEDIPIYEVSEWSEKKPKGEDIKEKDIEEKVLYNGKEGDKLVFDEYYEDFYLVFKVNDLYNESCRTLQSIEKKTDIVLTEKTFYRTKKLVEFE